MILPEVSSVAKGGQLCIDTPRLQHDVYTLVSTGIKFVGLSNSLAKTEIFSCLPSLQLSSELNIVASSITGHSPLQIKERTWAVRDKFGLCSHDRCVCGAKGDPNHCATVCSVTKPFYFTKPSAEDLSTWCVNIVQDKISLTRLMNIMKILLERRHDVIMD
ncbi:hypothetical protein AVEN_153308-1 [Araneus ventricosus]|uniref:Uncharacterized protein n=1 Tax=Araneus ventricosus TaxID=182803 RepID=A0A4Y2IE88_ARAVE|nr:hypothetical protein AVEN_153308-1 [Araneus ventricosus]